MQSWLVKSLATLILCAFTGVFAGCNDRVSDKDIEMASLGETRALLQDKPGTAKAIDSRPAAEFAAGHIPGAINLELSQVPESKDSIDPALAAYKYLIVYGADPGSGTARAMAKRLMRSGHKDVKLFSGGYAEWTGSGLRTEGSGKAAPPAPRK